MFLAIMLLACATIGSVSAGSSPRGECIPTSVDHSKFHCYGLGTGRGGVDEKEVDDDDENNPNGCVDADPDCPGWAEQGECSRNANYMMLHCPRSCETCVNGHAGIVQVAPSPSDERRRAVAQRLAETQAYLRHKVQLSARFLQTCRNHDALCTHWATLGECERNPDVMRQTCPAACRKC